MARRRVPVPPTTGTKTDPVLDELLGGPPPQQPETTEDTPSPDDEAAEPDQAHQSDQPDEEYQPAPPDQEHQPESESPPRPRRDRERREPERSAPQTVARPRITVYISEDVQEALRAAVYWTNNQPGGYDNLSMLLEDAALEKIRKLERRYNNGQPFAPMPHGRHLRRGRPIGH